MGGKWFNQRSNWLFAGLPREFQAARLRPPGRSACPKRRLAKPVLDKSGLVSKRKNFVSRARTTLLRSVVLLVLGPDARAHVVTLFPENSIRKDNFVLHLNAFKCILDYSNKEILYF